MCALRSILALLMLSNFLLSQGHLTMIYIEGEQKKRLQKGWLMWERRPFLLAESCDVSKQHWEERATQPERACKSGTGGSLQLQTQFHIFSALTVTLQWAYVGS